ncbi:Putative H(+)-driven transporter involved in L-cystine export [Komagataella phaffii CBS 7435]|uniref:Protein with similarity to human cystinosin, which is a H(+)-driven transporter n=2 Tax=Komagataella phaffii TaxID=460519 RepID=C4R120_KOMPG|nr:uncharacterized protein PAS_chr2-1_0560 [Komagataella phaffii GS115]AOA62353.1 GQ67_00614T0 [Komagataella phaffii]CAH2448281.1 cystinosin-like protein [Komagataella phaffii CBS 7435]AOA68130.1 GQ68_00774T0 [Komagataella phaffii GS115]CAY69194.1 Protein with similarity to human cystinosin, which is a H(+)-driven transporter [Komagataella phaffii GS115]CCA38415.1 Putative H(+)-driven transporter involved in L-cystine export [Komagataella phaffii CBS 7435]
MLNLISTISGWAYVVTWSLGFWPPLLVNIATKSVTGLSIDFIYFNFVGYVVYVIYYASFLYNDTIRSQFSKRYTKPPSSDFESLPLVNTNDLIYALHGLIINTLVLSQAYCWGYRKNRNQKLSTPAKLFFLGCLVYVCIMVLSIELHSGLCQWLDLLNSLGIMKIGMSIGKNIPQILYIYKRKSTKGWPIQVIFFDSIGASLSLIQLTSDAISSKSFDIIVTNTPKLVIAIEVLICNLIMFTQHYYFYRDELPIDQREPQESMDSIIELSLKSYGSIDHLGQSDADKNEPFRVEVRDSFDVESLAWLSAPA